MQGATLTCWQAEAQPREILQVKNKDGKLAWPEAHDYKKGKRRFKSDLIPAPILLASYFTVERDAIETLEDVFDYTEMYYNPKRRHGFNEKLSPIEFEKRHSLRLRNV